MDKTQAALCVATAESFSCCMYNITSLSQEGHCSSFPGLLVLLYKFVNANKGKVMKILYMQLIEHYFVEQKVEVDLFHVTY